MLKRLLVLATLFLSATGASAAVLLTLTGGAPTESGGIFTYHYTARLQAEAILRAPAGAKPGDFFTLYDFAGLQGTVDATNFVGEPNLPLGGPFNFDVQSFNSGNTPPDLSIPLLVADDPTIPNVTVTLTGPTDIVPAGKNVDLGTLTLRSTNGGLGKLEVASEFLQVQGLHAAANNSFVSIPIPEPSSYAFMGLGLLGVVAFGLRARNRG